MPNELKPCPFCGGNAIFVWLGKQKNDRKTGEPLHIHKIMCDNTDCAANIGDYWHKEDSTSAWNTRALLPAAQTAKERCMIPECTEGCPIYHYCHTGQIEEDQNDQNPDT